MLLLPIALLSAENIHFFQLWADFFNLEAYCQFEIRI